MTRKTDSASHVGADASRGHTPGPWFNLRPNARDGFATIGTKGPNGPTRHIAETCWDDEQARADANLIAAAPEMLEALEYLVSLGGGDCLDIARAAIAKARPTPPAGDLS